MALLLKKDCIKGAITDSYNRIKFAEIVGTKQPSINIMIDKYGSEDYRQENENDSMIQTCSVELTVEELSTISEIFYTALKRVDKYKNAVDC